MKRTLVIVFLVSSITVLGVKRSSIQSLSCVELKNVEALTSGDDANPRGCDGKNEILGQSLQWEADGQEQASASLEGEITIYNTKIGDLEAEAKYNIIFAGWLCKECETDPTACCDQKKQKMSSYTMRLLSKKTNQ